MAGECAVGVGRVGIGAIRCVGEARGPTKLDERVAREGACGVAAGDELIYAIEDSDVRVGG